jgi:hypothetical protein
MPFDFFLDYLPLRSDRRAKADNARYKQKITLIISKLKSSFKYMGIMVNAAMANRSKLISARRSEPY